MRYNVFFFCILLALGNTCYHANAQQTAAYRDIELTYRTAIDLFAKQKYSAAAKHFEEVVAHQKGKSNEMVINSQYHIGLAHLYLFRKDAEQLLLTFLRENPQASQCRSIYFLLGRHYYQQKRYPKALEYLTQVDKFSLSETQLAEYYFKLGHSYFLTGKKNEATNAFNEIRNTENAYQQPATYYYAHLAYEDKKYQAALENFQKLEKVEGYRNIVPYYITQIYYFQHEYEKAIEYGVPLLDSVVPKREAEINLLIGSSFYNLKKYDQAYPYLEKYSKLGAPGREESYRIGYSAYETKQYSKAITWLGKCVNEKDELAQTAWYHTAMAYLKLNKKEEARQTFSHSMKLDFNPTLQEDAHYNYVKLNYELGFNPYHDAIASVKQYLDKYPDSKRTEEMKTYLVQMFIAGKNYESAYNTLNEIKNKDLALQRSFQQVVFNLATDYFLKSDFEKSRKYYAEVKKYPIEKELNAESYYWTGESNYMEAKWDDAIQGYTRFLEEPGAVNSIMYNRAQYNLGYCYMQKGYMSGNNTRGTRSSGNNTTGNAKEYYTQSLVHFRTFVDDKNEKDNVRLNDAYLRIGDIYYIRADNSSALSYYDKAYTSGIAGSKDYALYQKAMCAGLTGKKDEKISLLKNLLNNYKQSKYLADAKFEIADTYRVLEDKNNALEYYTRVVQEHPDKFLKVKEARFEIALIHYRNKNYAKSEETYKAILNDYPNADDVERALDGLKPVLDDQGRINDWLILLKKYNLLDERINSADTTYFNSAERIFQDEKNYEKAIAQFTSYLEQFKPARFELQANYYLAVSYEKTGKMEQAIPYYEKVLNMPTNLYTQAVVKTLAYYYVDKQEWPKAIEYENRIEQTSTDETELLFARLAQLRGHYALKNQSEIFNYAKKVLDSKNAKDEDKAEAYYYRAKSAYEQNNTTDAEADFKQVQKLTTKEWKAEAGYTVILIHYNKGEHKQVEKEIFDFSKQKPTYNYWNGKAFILLGNNYAKLDDIAQAKATLKSVIDNYKAKGGVDDGIIAEAQAAYDAIVAGENQQQEQKRMEINKTDGEPVINEPGNE